MRGQRILVVDDDPEIVEVCTRVLRSSGFVVESSLDCIEAVALLREREFDLIIADLMMSDIDGLEILRIAREYTPSTAGIIITGYGTMERAIESLRVGAQDFVEKPFSPEDLIVAVQNVLERRQSLYEDLRLELWMPILNVIDALTIEINLDQLSRLIAETINFIFRADHVSLLLLDDEGEHLSVAATVGLSDEITEAIHRTDKGIAERALRVGSPITLRTKVDGDSPASDETEQADAFWTVCLPLQIRGQATGVLNVSRLPDGPAFGQNDLQLLATLCGPITIAIENARLYAESRQQADELIALWHIGQDISSTLDQKIVLERIARWARQLIGSNGVALYLLDSKANLLQPVVSLGAPTTQMPQSPIRVGEGIIGWVAQAGVGEIVNQTELDPRAVQIPGTSKEVESLLCLPILSKGKVIGVMSLNRLGDRFFCDDDLHLLGRIAYQAAIAIENARLYEETQRRAMQLATAAEVSRDAISTLDMRQLLTNTVSLIRDRFGFYHAGVFLVDDAGEYAVLHAATSEAGRKMLEQQHKLKVGEVGLVGYVAQRGEPRIALHVGQDAMHFDNPLLPDTRSEMALPLTARGRVIGVLDVQSTEEATFSDEDIAVLQTMADQLATAIENARLYEEERRRAEELAALNAITETVSRSLDLDTILDEALNKIFEVIDADVGGIYLLDERNDELTLAAHRGLPEPVFQKMRHLKMGEGAIGQTAQSVMPVLVDSLTVDDELRAETERVVLEESFHSEINLPWAIEIILKRLSTSQEGFQAEVNVPLSTQGRVHGVLSIARHHKQSFTSWEVEFLTAIGNQIAVAIKNARLYQETTRRLKEAESLHGVSVALTRSLDLDKVLQAILDSAVATISAASTGTIHLADESRGRLMPKAASHHQFVAAEMGGMAPGQGVAGLAWKEKRIIHIADVSRDPRFIALGNADTSFRSMLVAPLMMSDSCLGTISLHSNETDAFTPDDERLLSTLASQAAIAIENARLYEKVTGRMIEATVLHQVSNTLMRTFNLQQLLESILRALQRSFGYSHCAILLVDEKREKLRIEAARGYLRDTVRKLEFKIDQEGIVGWVAANSMPLNVPDVTQYDRYVEKVKGIRSEIAVPMLVGEKLVGVLDVQSTEVNAFGEDDLRTLSSITALAAIAIERARLYAATLAERERTERILTSIADGVITMDQELRILSLNPVAEQMTGWQEAEAIGRPCAEVLSLTSESGESLCIESLKELSEYNFPRAILARKHGHSTHVSVSLSPLLDPTDQTIGGVIAIRDRSAEIEFDRMRSEMVAMVSHELRSPLANMQVAMELALTSDFEEDLQREMLNIARSQCARLASFVEELLDISQLETGQIAVQQEPVTLLPLIQRVVSTFEATEGREHRFQIIGQDALPFAWADLLKVEIILTNLLQNAVNYSPDGSTITIEVKTPDDAHIAVSVGDEGEGIHEEHLEQIFQPYHRIGNKSMEKVPGRGLGLYIVKKLVEMQGGRVWVESKVGKGSLFNFTLPRMMEER